MNFQTPDAMLRAFAAVALLTGALRLAAQSVPSTMNYQGRLTDNTPQQGPVTATVPMRFDVFDAATAGTSLWNETDTVAVNGGVFSLLLGATSPIPPFIFMNGTQRWLQITLNPGASQEVLAPRQQFSAYAYADQAQKAALATNSTQLNGVPDTGWQKALSGPCPAGQYLSAVAQGGAPTCATPATNIPSPLNVAGNSASPIIYGSNAGAGAGLYGDSASGNGLSGYGANAGVGGTGAGVNGNGVYGVSGSGGGAKGVYGTTANGYGVYGEATTSGGYGVTALNTVSGFSAILANANYAGYFTGPLYASGNVSTAGSVSATGRIGIGVYTQVCSPTTAISNCACNGSDPAIGGGAYAHYGQFLRESRPGNGPTYWTVTCETAAGVDVACWGAYAVCLLHGN